jgi:hypothetical protein
MWRKTRVLVPQSTYINRVPQCMSPRRNWDSPTPLSQARVPLPPEPGGAHSPAGEGLGEFQFRRLEKKLSTLPTLVSLVQPAWGGGVMRDLYRDGSLEGRSVTAGATQWSSLTVDIRTVYVYPVQKTFGNIQITHRYSSRQQVQKPN